MTVSELIEQLSRFSGDLVVWTDDGRGVEQEASNVFHLPATQDPDRNGGQREARVYVL